MQPEYSWKFPSLGGAERVGFNNAAIDTFLGNRLSSVVREVIQNSLDAHDQSDNPVRVRFSLELIKGDDVPEVRSLRSSLQSCLIKANDEDNQAAIRFFENAISRISVKSVPFFCIHDSNTIGLVPKAWEALVKSTGVSRKLGENALGSYGHGSKAPFALSELRTVFYLTKTSEDIGTMRFQGKSILQSHENSEGKETAATGFFGNNAETEVCGPVLAKDIPSWATDLRVGNYSGKGTSVLIPLTIFRADLYPETTITVLANFYYAIKQGHLEVEIGEEYTINQSTVDGIYFSLKDKLDEEKDEIDINQIKKCFDSISTIISPTNSGTLDLNDFGEIDWFVRDGEGVKGRAVAISRNNGMLITKKAPKLKRFPATREFDMFLCVRGVPGSELLKTLENPAHDQFSFDRINDQAERRDAENRYETFAQEIRGLIINQAGYDQSDSTILEELSEFFSIISDDETGSGDSQDRSANLKVNKVAKTRTRPLSDGYGDEDSGEGSEGHRNRDAGTKATGDGDMPGKDRPGDEDGDVGLDIPSTKKRPITVRGLRVVVGEKSDSQTLTIYFDPPPPGKYSVQIYKVGESYREAIDVSLDSSEGGTINIIDNSRFSQVVHCPLSVCESPLEVILNEVE